ncbi:MAG: hypothetical protein IPK83_05245 [Planctomycetes bacterium]|nr:hypothetical protein [Planctomycetota bacterium]
MAQAETLNGKALVEAAIADVGEIATLPEVTVKIIQIVENPKSTARDCTKSSEMTPRSPPAS